MPLKMLEEITSAITGAMKRQQDNRKPARQDDVEEDEPKAGKRIKKSFNKALNMDDEEK